MNNYYGSFSNWGGSQMPWNPPVADFSSAGGGATPASSLALSPGANYTTALNDLGSALPGAVTPGLMDTLRGWGVFDSKNANGTTNQGWGMPALAAGQGIFNAWMGLKQYGLFKDQLAESKRQFGLNYDAQVKTTNSQLEDRQRARVASNPTAYQSVGDYMTANRIGG